LNICRFLAHKGYKIVVDRGFGFVRLVRELRKIGFQTLATIFPTRKEFPESLKPKTKKRTDELVLAYDELKAVQSDEGVTVLAWRSKRLVYHITNFHNIATLEHKVVRKGGKSETVSRPVLNKEYSRCMKGADVMNQREASYSSYRRVHLVLEVLSTHHRSLNHQRLHSSSETTSRFSRHRKSNVTISKEMGSSTHGIRCSTKKKPRSSLSRHEQITNSRKWFRQKRSKMQFLSQNGYNLSLQRLFLEKRHEQSLLHRSLF
jgi:hypothetical protein